MRYKATVMYDGTMFHGFQSQTDLRTVQDEIEKVLLIICKKKIIVYSSGRTDTGVHALGQVFHFDTDIKMEEWQMKNAINSTLPKDIYIKNIEIVDENFHSRFTPHIKTYKYVINLNEYNPLDSNYCYYYRYHLDVEKMIDASKIFIGVHDFKSFTKNHIIENTVRTIYAIDFEINNQVINIYFKGNGFLHNMIRIIVAMLLEVGNDRISKDDLKNILESKNRTLAPKLAPPNGLYLVKVEYNE